MKESKGLPKVDDAVVANVEAAEQEEARNKALAPTAGTDVVTEEVDPMAALAELGFADLQIDFTSFPTLVINKGQIRKSGGDIIDSGDSVELIIMDKRKTYLFRGIKDHNTDPELVYSDDKIHVNMTGDLVSVTTDKWKEEGLEIEVKDYFIVMGQVVGGSLDGEIVQLQIPKSSIGRFDGYLLTLALAKLNPKKVITKACLGAEVGSGMTAFTPWDFKRVK